MRRGVFNFIYLISASLDKNGMICKMHQRLLKTDLILAVVLYFSVAVNRVATYRELDHDLQKQAAFLTLVSVHMETLTMF